MILSVTFSKPAASVTEKLGNSFIRIKIKLLTASPAASALSSSREYLMEMYTQKQVFHKRLTTADVEQFITEHAGTTFKNCVQRTENEEITILANKKGKITRLSRKIENTPASVSGSAGASVPGSATFSKKKQYLLEEGIPVPFLVHLGVMTAEGKVINAKYDKFRQINRFLEFIDDILPAITEPAQGRPLRIVDFGSGKSYLTFAVHYFLTEIRHIPCDITGLDLKEDVIAYCNQLARDFHCEGLHFSVGDIASYGEEAAPDLVITLHACDTATDYALSYAVKRGTTAILSVPCCQHEVNLQLNRSKIADEAFAPLLKYGLIKERFAALATDALRAEYLEHAGYKVQILEFIDMSHTPKNLLIRAVKKGGHSTGASAATSSADTSSADTSTTSSVTAAATDSAQKKALAEAKALQDALQISPVTAQILR